MNWIEQLNRGPSRVSLGDLGAARVLHWAYNPALPDNVPHRHAYYEVCLVGKRGRGAFWVQNEWRSLSPGTLFFARPGVMHQIRSQAGDPLELSWVSFQIDPAPLPSPNRATLTRFAQSAVWTTQDTDDALGSLWQSLRANAAGPNTALTQARRDLLMSAVLLGIVDAGSGLPSHESPDSHSPDARTNLARAAVRYVHDHLSHPLSVAQLADHFGVSPRHLSRRIAALTGLAPAAYIETARLDRARFLLLRTDDPLKQIAAQVGYRDVQHFTRAFSRCFGCPPGVFRATGGSASRRLLSASEKNIGALV